MRRARVLMALLVVMAALGGVAVGTQAWRYSRCQQLSDQYVAALRASGTDSTARLLRPTVAQAHEAYQRACS